MLRTFTARLNLVYVGLLALFLAALGTYYAVATEYRLRKEFDRELCRDAEVFGKLYLEEMREIGLGVQEDWKAALRHASEVLEAATAVYSKDGKLLYANPAMEAGGTSTARPPVGGEIELRDRELRTPRHPGVHRVAFITVREPDLPDPVLVEFARSLRPLDRLQLRLRTGLLIAIPALVALASVVGYFFIRFALKPVRDMSALAREISAGDLSRRIPPPPCEGDIGALATTLNGMLGRLDESFGRMRQFTADAAHELRSPVQTMRSALESSLGKPAPQLEEAVGDTLEELGRLSEIVEKLLLLAKADAGRLAVGTAPVELGPLARQVVDVLQIAAEPRGIRLELEDRGLVVPGDAALLRRAIHNLVDNAVKYGRQGGRVEILVGPTELEVRDDGPGISPGDLPRIFDRFFRGDPSRSDRVAGSGLGLAIVRTIVAAHQGTVEVVSEPGRTSFRVRFQPKPQLMSG